MEYRHLQLGRAAAFGFVWGLAIAIALVGLADDRGDAALPAGIAFVVIEAVAVVFSRLTVTVGSGTVTAVFGWGWPKRTLAASEITAFRRVRNAWYNGWGRRRIPGGWMYNIWGLDAVELDLQSGKKFRIGTDEPDALIAALTSHTSLQPEVNS